jgi:hypothetical protein
MSTSITLTKGQQAASDAFRKFLLDPAQHILVLEGFAGTGKSTLVEHLIETLPKVENTLRLINEKFKGWETVLTATTNKACEALRSLSQGREVKTIHSHLGLKLSKDYTTGETILVEGYNSETRVDELIFIDEASFIDANLLQLIFDMTSNCKIVFMGDPAQLSPVKSSGNVPPVFAAGYPTARLTEVVRQAEGNPIIDLATAFRETVNSGEFFQFRPDGVFIEWMERSTWNKAIEAEFTRPEWRFDTSKVLAWTNRTVIAYNHGIRAMVKGDPEFAVGDYGIVNNYLSGGGGKRRQRALKTDQMVEITSMDSSNYAGTPGWDVTLDNHFEAFLPETLTLRKQAITAAKAKSNFSLMKAIDETWVDLRAAYSCTINKSQGSTYDTVYIDLDDIKACNQPNQIARMLYVAVSRARNRVIFTGDLV